MQSRPYFQLTCVFLLLGTICMTIGCGDSNGRQSISGTVTVDGKPLENGEIVFLPAQGTDGPIAAVGIENGEFKIAAEKGPVVGAYRVEITADRKTGKKIQADELSSEMVDQLEQYLPPKYNDQSELTAEIVSGGPPLSFDLATGEK